MWWHTLPPRESWAPGRSGLANAGTATRGPDERLTPARSPESGTACVSTSRARLAAVYCIEHGCKGDNMSSLSTAVLVQLYSVSRVRARRIVNWSSLATGFRLSPSTLGRPAPEGLRYRKFASARTCRVPVNTHTDNTHAGMPCRARCWRALAHGSRASSRPARRRPRPSMQEKAVARRATRRPMPAAPAAAKLHLVIMTP